MADLVTMTGSGSTVSSSVTGIILFRFSWISPKTASLSSSSSPMTSLTMLWNVSFFSVAVSLVPQPRPDSMNSACGVLVSLV